MSSPQTWARVAGLLYMFNIAASVFALVATNGLFVANDAARTAENILAAEPLFRSAFVAILLANGAYVAVIAILFAVMKPAGATLSTIASIERERERKKKGIGFDPRRRSSRRVRFRFPRPRPNVYSVSGRRSRFVSERRRFVSNRPAAATPWPG